MVDPGTGIDALLDLLIEGERVTALAPRIEPPAGALVIDATGLLVLPGFVDIHTHSDFTLQHDPAALARLHQGITTDVTGNCGFSPFPLPRTSLGFGSFFNSRLDPGFPDLTAYAAHLESLGTGINIAPLIGLGAVREHIVGSDPRPPSDEAVAAMRQLVAGGLDQGAFGVSSGLVYQPGRFAAADELRRVIAPVRQSGRFYATHLRDERDGLVTAVAEAISTAEDAGVDLQISHHKALGKANWGRTELTLAMVDEANARGDIAVAVDYYPYTSGSTGVSSLLPPGSLDGGWGLLRAQAGEGAERRRLLRHLDAAAQFRPDEIIIGQSRNRPEASGRALPEYAAGLGQAAVEVLLELIMAEGESLTIPELSRSEGISEPHVAKMMRILRRGGFVRSTRGQSGGYSLARPADQIVLGHALAVLGGRLYEPAFCEGHSGSAVSCTHMPAANFGHAAALESRIGVIKTAATQRGLEPNPLAPRSCVLHAPARRREILFRGDRRDSVRRSQARAADDAEAGFPDVALIAEKTRRR